MPATRVPLSRGHLLFDEWLSLRYGAAGRGGVPAFEALRRFLDDLNASLAPDGVPLARGTTVYLWMARSKARRRPGREFRAGIERLSRGLVPADSWLKPPTADATPSRLAA